MNHRLKRINELLKREISTIFQKEFVFRNCLVTVNAIEINQDLRDARVFLGIVGNEGAKEDALDLIRSKRALIQTRVSKRVVLRQTPHLEFRVDDSVERGVRVISIMDQIDIPDELPPLDSDA